MSADALFTHIERLRGAVPWGSFLDAGTGSHSLEWVSGLSTTRWTAVTGEVWRAEALEREFRGRMRPGDRIITGDWTDPLLLHGDVHDIVLADYLLGAVDRFAPYFQESLFSRLRPLVGHRLYVVGLEPHADSDDPAARIVLEISRLRDAMILLAGHRCHREYPREWAVRHLEAAGFSVEDARAFPIVYGAGFIHEQCDVCLRKLPFLLEKGVRTELKKAIGRLRARALEECALRRGLAFGEDYVIDARPR